MWLLQQFKVNFFRLTTDGIFSELFITRWLLQAWLGPPVILKLKHSEFWAQNMPKSITWLSEQKVPVAVSEINQVVFVMETQYVAYYVFLSSQHNSGPSHIANKYSEKWQYVLRCLQSTLADDIAFTNKLRAD